MTVAQRELPSKVNENATSLAREWRRLGRAATAVALLTSPAVFVLFHNRYGWAWPWALLGALAVVVVFRAVVDIVAHRLIPTPSLYGTGSELREDDVISRRRLWYWKRKLRRLLVIGTLLLIVLGAIALINGESLGDAAGSIVDSLPSIATQAIGLGATLVVLFFINFLILFGPFVAMAVQQIKSYEPGEADWGVRLDDVRGQAEAKEEITRVVSLWQSGEEFEKAGGKRERGVLFLGAPGTGKTMLSKAIATSFNCPFVTIPGSGFAQMFMGMDAVTVRILARRAKKMAAKWGGQCIVFIDEIDAVGTRRQSLGSGFQPLETRTVHDMLFYGPDGALTSDGDLVVETAAWRERLFAMRSQPRGPIYPPVIEKLAGAIRHAIVPGMMGGQGSGLALNQLLVVMDGIDEPPLTRRVLTRRLNTFLDALYFVPQRLGRLRLRLKPPRPRKEEVYFVGACNVPLEQLDPALVRPGRMGRHIYFRTPTWEDRRDIFDLYLGKVAHDEDLDTERARDELARITNGYSPAMIDQACSLALTYAHSDGRIAFSRHDLVAAMTTVEAGVAIGQPYPKHEERATAIHEAGHAVCGHLFMESSLSTRLSIRKRGSSGGHHQMMAVEDRFGRWRSEQVGNLIWGLGAMAAEHVFYDQNTTGVGGDVASVTMQAAQMVGMHAMAPAPIDLSDRIPDPEEREAEEKRAMERFERLGEQIMHRSGGGLMDSNPFMATLGDRNKARLVSGLLGQAFVVAWCTVRENREATERIAQRLIDKGELYGDEVTDLLESAHLHRPDIDVRDEATWPAI
jgi:SpoVK/Ycf46/Vps4 family AAA+-type ATPase